MVNPERIKQKIPLMISNKHSLSWEYEEKEYLLEKFKRNAPNEYASEVNNLVDIYKRIEQKALAQKKRHNGNGKH